MTLKEKIEREKPDQINLYREGMFWKLYNRSAFHFFRLIKPYLVKKKYIKELKTEIVCMGFPHSILTDILNRLQTLSVSIEQEEKEITVRLKESPDGYENWFGQFQIAEKEEEMITTSINPISEKSCSVMESIIQALRDFPIMQKTPLEVQLFVLQLQEQLKSAGAGN